MEFKPDNKRSISSQEILASETEKLQNNLSALNLEVEEIGGWEVLKQALTTTKGLFYTSTLSLAVLDLVFGISAGNVPVALIGGLATITQTAGLSEVLKNIRKTKELDVDMK